MLLVSPHARRWKKSEYYQAAELGWFNGQRVELIDGEVVELAPQKDQHSAALRLTDLVVRKAFPSGHVFGVQMPMNFGPDSQPEPDLFVVRGTARRVLTHPKTAVLVVEIADSSLSYDREHKSRLYASRGIRDYWVVNLIDRQLEMYRRPVADAHEPFGYSYSQVTLHKPSDIVRPSPPV